MTIAIGSDHAGFELKEIIEQYLQAQHTLVDYGTHSTASVDYPDHAHPTAEAVTTAAADMGILICGSANGVAITANKHAHIRAAVCWNSDIAILARQHNDANVLCLPARFLDADTALHIVNNFINTPFVGGRHEARVKKIDKI